MGKPMTVGDIRAATDALASSSARSIEVAQSLIDVAAQTKDERLVELAEECLRIAEVGNDAWHKLVRALIASAREAA
jgi:hypothetical protein